MSISNRIFGNPNTGVYNHRKEVQVIDKVATILPVNSTADGVVLQDGDRVLFTNLSSPDNNKIFKLKKGVFEVAIDSTDSSGKSKGGDVVYVIQGTSGGSLYAYEGTWELLDVDTDAGGDVNSASNVGGANGLFKQKTEGNLEFKTLAADGAITITPVGDTLVIGTPASSGEANTASNVGSGAGLFKQKTGVDLELKSVNSSNGISVAVNASDISIDGLDASPTQSGMVNTAAQSLAGVKTFEDGLVSDEEIILDSSVNAYASVRSPYAATGDSKAMAIASGDSLVGNSGDALVASGEVTKTVGPAIIVQGLTVQMSALYTGKNVGNQSIQIIVDDTNVTNPATPIFVRVGSSGQRLRIRVNSTTTVDQLITQYNTQSAAIKEFVITGSGLTTFVDSTNQLLPGNDAGEAIIQSDWRARIESNTVILGLPDQGDNQVGINTPKVAGALNSNTLFILTGQAEGTGQSGGISMRSADMLGTGSSGSSFIRTGSVNANNPSGSMNISTGGTNAFSGTTSGAASMTTGNIGGLAGISGSVNMFSGSNNTNTLFKTGDITNGSNTVSNINTTGLFPGLLIMGNGIQRNTFINSVGVNSIVLTSVAQLTTVGVTLNISGGTGTANIRSSSMNGTASYATGSVSISSGTKQNVNGSGFTGGVSLFSGNHSGITGGTGSVSLVSGNQTGVNNGGARTADTTISSNQLTNVSDMTNIYLGGNITGPGIPANTTISSTSGTTITLSQNATATATGITFNFAMATGNASLLSGSITNASSVGNTGVVSIGTGNNSGSGSTGTMGVTTGSNSGSGNSGYCIFGSGNANTGSSGGVDIRSGSVSSGTGSAGQVNVSSGSTVNGVSGNVYLQSGSHSGTSGNGTASVFVQTGQVQGALVGGTTGNLLYSTGSVTNAGSTANTGDINLTTGTNAGSGNRGSVNLTGQYVQLTSQVGGNIHMFTETNGAVAFFANGVQKGQFATGTQNVAGVNTDLTLFASSQTATNSLGIAAGSDAGGAAAGGNLALAAGNATGGNRNGGNVTIQAGNGNGTGTNGKVNLNSLLNLAVSSTPTSPANGDIWFDGTNLFMRIGGVTKTITMT